MLFKMTHQQTRDFNFFYSGRAMMPLLSVTFCQSLTDDHMQGKHMNPKTVEDAYLYLSPLVTPYYCSRHFKF